MFKTVVTVGPKSISTNVLKDLKKAGADCFRINLSHSNEELFIQYAEIMNNSGVRPSIDTQGAQGRIIKAIEKRIYTVGERIRFVFEEDLISSRLEEGVATFIINHKEILEQVGIGDKLRIDFSGLVIAINEINIESKEFYGRVITEGGCEDNRAFDIANKPLKLKAHTRFDEWAIRKAEEIKDHVYILSTNMKTGSEKYGTQMR